MVDNRTLPIGALSYRDGVGAGVDGQLDCGEDVRDDNGAGERGMEPETAGEKETDDAANRKAGQENLAGWWPTEDRQHLCELRLRLRGYMVKREFSLAGDAHRGARG